MTDLVPHWDTAHFPLTPIFLCGSAVSLQIPAVLCISSGCVLLVVSLHIKLSGLLLYNLRCDAEMSRVNGMGCCQPENPEGSLKLCW